MEKLANITQTDINNGVLNRMLLDAGISDVQDYVEKFHQQTEDLIIDEFEHPDSNKTQNDEQIAPPAAVQSWITGLRLRLNDPIKPPVPELQQQQQHQQPPPPANLTSWMQRMVPTDLNSSTDITTSETTTTSNDDTAVTGNLGTWLNDWSKSLAEQPPPTSLDNWLQSLIPTNMNEPISKATNPKGRLNTYLNAAQEVLSRHGYKVSNEVTPPTSIETKTGMFGNVKQMYFLVSCHLLSSKLIIYICSVLFHPVENLR
jgi:hypothetical protein